MNEHVSSLNDCIGRCAQFNINNHKTEAGLQQICSTVCWRNNGPNDDWPGNCFGYAVDTTSGQLPVAKKEVICDSAVWIDMPNGKS